MDVQQLAYNSFAKDLQFYNNPDVLFYKGIECRWEGYYLK